ncbi:MAG: hypothetical protein E6G39_12355 [Actinobacteria bacterium]|nr:MAG: hypothetical protein E6G39_12355 [Actinomycetota bacterium]
MPIAAPTTSAPIDHAQYRAVFALAFDDSAVYGRSITGSINDPGGQHDDLARFDRRTGTIITADAVTRPLAALRAGDWLFVVAVVFNDDCITACRGELLRVDPQTLQVEHRFKLDRVSNSLTVVGDTLWVATAHGVVRVSINAGETLASPQGDFGETETIVGLAAPPHPNRVYAVVAQPLQRYALASLDPTSGRLMARGPMIGSGPGGAGISAGDDGLWFSIATGMLGYSVKVDPDTLTALDVRLDAQARPTALQGTDALWVDESWGGSISCADRATGTILWRQAIADSPVSFARDTTGRATPFHEWKPIETPTLCKTREGP